MQYRLVLNNKSYCSSRGRCNFFSNRWSKHSTLPRSVNILQAQILQCQSSKFCNNRLFRRSSLLRIAHTLLQAPQVCLAKSSLYSSKSVSKDTQLTTQCLLILSSHRSSRPSGMQIKHMQQVIIHRSSAWKQTTYLKISSLSCFNSKYYMRRLQVNLFNRIKDSLLIKTVLQLVFQCSQYLTIKRQRKDKSLLTHKRSVHSNKQLMH